MKDEEDFENESVLKECSLACQKHDVPCPFNSCKNWINYEKDHNCDLISIEKNGEMTFREIGERLGVSYVRVKQIESAAIKKIKKLVSKQVFPD